MAEGVLWIRITETSLVWPGRCEIWQVNLTVTTAAKGVTLYDNAEKTASHQAQRIQTYNQETLNFPFYMGRVLQQGLYIVCDAEVTECVVAITPLP